MTASTAVCSMGGWNVRLRCLGIAVILGCLLAATGCGSTTSTTLAPSQLPRCGVTLGATDSTVPAEGGTGHLTVTTARECSWVAASEAGWISIRGASSGQGDGSIEYAVAANPDPATRQGSILLNNQRAQITQAAGECALQLQQSSASFSPTGGSGTVDVRASSALCTWTAAADSSWIVIRSGANGKGNASVTFDVAPTSGPPRTGTILIGGLRFGITQSLGCTYSVAPTSYPVASSGGNGTLTVTTAEGCPWTAASNSPWIALADGATGSGPDSVTFTVGSTDGPTRTGTLLVAGQTVTVTQSAGCRFTVAPMTFEFAAGGGDGSVAVDSSAGCTWSASSDAPWISIVGAASGSGRGAVAFKVAGSSGAARGGTLTVAGEKVTVTQGQGCSYTIAPENQTVGAAGASGTVNVTAGDGCPWTATSGVTWITITAGASGSGNGAVQYTVAATDGPSRTGTLTIAGRTFTVNQGAGCAVSLSPADATVPAAGGTGHFDVKTASGCSWTAIPDVPWISITSGASGSGNGTVNFTAAANTGPARSGTITVNGRTFTLSQASGCTATIAPISQDVPSSGGTGNVAVSLTATCTWTAVSNAQWITIDSGAGGTGNGTVKYTVAANTGGARTGTLTIAGQTFTVNQALLCTYSLSPTQRNIGSAGGATSVNVSTSNGCPWTATSNVLWIIVTSGATGSGSGKVDMNVAQNLGAARTGTVTIGGQTFTVNQDAR